MKKKRKAERCMACKKAARKIISRRKHQAICHKNVLKPGLFPEEVLELLRYIWFRDSGIFACRDCVLLWRTNGAAGRRPSLDELRTLHLETRP